MEKTVLASKKMISTNERCAEHSLLVEIHYTKTHLILDFISLWDTLHSLLNTLSQVNTWSMKIGLTHMLNLKQDLFQQVSILRDRTVKHKLKEKK